MERCQTWDIAPACQKLPQGRAQDWFLCNACPWVSFPLPLHTLHLSCNIRKQSVPCKWIFQILQAYLLKDHFLHFHFNHFDKRKNFYKILVSLPLNNFPGIQTHQREHFSFLPAGKLSALACLPLC